MIYWLLIYWKFEGHMHLTTTWLNHPAGGVYFEKCSHMFSCHRQLYRALRVKCQDAGVDLRFQFQKRGFIFLTCDKQLLCWQHQHFTVWISKESVCVFSLPHSTGVRWKAGEGLPSGPPLCSSFHHGAPHPQRCRWAHTGCFCFQGFVSLLPVETSPSIK